MHMIHQYLFNLPKSKPKFNAPSSQQPLRIQWIQGRRHVLIGSNMNSNVSSQTQSQLQNSNDPFEAIFGFQ